MFGFMSRKDRKIKNLEVMVRNRDKLIDIQNKNINRANIINTEHQKINGELRVKIKDLENNIEFLTNNLSNQKRKLLGL